MTTHELHISDRVVMIDDPTYVGTIVDVKRTYHGPQFIVEFDGGIVGVYGSALLLVSPVAA